MAITLADFNKIWSSTSPLSPYTFSDDDYNEGWNFIGQIPPSRQMWDFLQKNNDEKMQYLANNYLPLSGGTMTGDILFGTNGESTVKKTVDISAIRILSGSTWSGGGSVFVYGKNNSGSNPGGFELNAHDGTNVKSLIGKPDGSLKWGGQNVLTASNYNSYALPLSGGTVTGGVTFNAQVTAFTDKYAKLQSNYANSGGFISFNGGNGDSEGARLVLHGKNEDNGSFNIIARSSSAYKQLIGRADGTLTWDGQPLLPVGIVQAFAGTTIPNGWLLCDGSAVSRITYANLFACIGTTYGAGDGSTTFNLPNLIDKFVEGSATSGTVKSAGLPNIEGKLNGVVQKTSDGKVAGVSMKGDGVFNGGTALNVGDGTASFDSTPQYATQDYIDYTPYYPIRFNASGYNSIYGNSTTVQPPALTMQYIIKY